MDLHLFSNDLQTKRWGLPEYPAVGYKGDHSDGNNSCTLPRLSSSSCHSYHFVLGARKDKKCLIGFHALRRQLRNQRMQNSLFRWRGLNVPCWKREKKKEKSKLKKEKKTNKKENQSYTRLRQRWWTCNSIWHFDLEVTTNFRSVEQTWCCCWDSTFLPSSWSLTSWHLRIEKKLANLALQKQTRKQIYERHKSNERKLRT